MIIIDLLDRRLIFPPLNSLISQKSETERGPERSCGINTQGSYLALEIRNTSTTKTWVTYCNSPGVRVNTRYIGMYLSWSLCILYLHACQVKVAVGDSGLCCCTCYVFRALINSLVCWFPHSSLKIHSAGYVRITCKNEGSLCWQPRAIKRCLGSKHIKGSKERLFIRT